MLQRNNLKVYFPTGILRKLIVLACFWVAGCVYPVKVSTECQAQINRCLANCDATSNHSDQTPSVSDQRTLTDYRSQCESQCHTLCHWIRPLMRLPQVKTTIVPVDSQHCHHHNMVSGLRRYGVVMTRLIRILLMIALFIVSTSFSAACTRVQIRQSMKEYNIIIKPGNNIRPRSYEDGTGTTNYMETQPGKGDTLMIIIRGKL